MDDITSALQKLIERGLQKPPQGENYEIEARLHKRGHERHLTKMEMDHILSQFEKAPPGVFDVQDWNETNDFFFTLGKSIQVRSTFKTNSEEINSVCENIVKTRVGMITLRSEEEDWKICLSRERSINPKFLPDVVKPNYVRIKQRKRFIYTSPQSAGSLKWAFDFTLTWAGVTKTEAETRQRTTEPTYEFEIELLECHEDIDAKYVTASLLMKIMDHAQGKPQLHHCSFKS